MRGCSEAGVLPGRPFNRQQGRLLGAEARCDPQDVRSHRLEVRVAVVRRPGHGALDDAAQFGIEFRLELPERLGEAMHDAVGQCRQVVARERLPVGEQFVQHESDGEDVAAMIEGLPVICSGDM